MLNIDRWFAEGGLKPLIIAEIGINHGGSLSDAKKLAELAIESGVDVVKHQTHIPIAEMSVEAESKIIPYLGKSIFDLMDECKLSIDEELELKEFVEAADGTYISTPFSLLAADILDDMGVPFFKIGSGEARNVHFVEHIASKGKPVFISTGMSSVREVAASINVLEASGVPFLVFHTTNCYPCPPEAVRLRGMDEIKLAFGTPFVGLSDHTESNFACFAALARGGKAVERHFTDTKMRKGPDIQCSMTPNEARELVGYRDNLLAMDVDDAKGLHAVEAEVAEFATQSVASLRALSAGETLDTSMIALMRPIGGDFGVSDFSTLLGKRLLRDVPARTQLLFGDVDV